MKVQKEDFKKLMEMIKDVKICMMTTIEEDGSLHSRPMATVNVEEDGTIWFFTNEYSPKVDEVEEDNHINLAYMHKGNADYVSVSGTARIVTNKDYISELWTPALKAWFPEGKDDTRLALIKVRPYKAEYWDDSSSKMKRLFNYAKAVLTSATYDDAENKKLNLR